MKRKKDSKEAGRLRTLSNAKLMTPRQAIAHARKNGIRDPWVECHKHGVKMKLSELSPIARIALEAGLDTDRTCLLEE